MAKVGPMLLIVGIFLLAAGPGDRGVATDSENRVCGRMKGRLRWYCNYCVMEKNGAAWRKKNVCESEDDAEYVCENPEEYVPPASPEPVDTKKHVCGLRNGTFRWYCSYCALQKHGARFKYRKKCNKKGASTAGNCTPEPGIDIVTREPATMQSTTTPAPPRTVFPPLEPFCLPPGEDRKICPCPSGIQLPDIDFSIPDIIQRNACE